MLCALLLFTICVSKIVVATSPNIVLIVADDMGYNDVGYHRSNEIKTPNIDALAYNGHILEEYYAGPTCTPSRAALTTGKYAIRTGFQGEPLSAGEPRAMPLDVPMLQEELRKLNYKTHLVGKWHLGYDYRNVTPTHRGFDDHYGYWNGYVSYKNHTYRETNGFDGFDMRDNFKVNFETIGQYATDLFTNRAVNIIETHNESEPLFLMYAHLAPHCGAVGIGAEVRNEQHTRNQFPYIRNAERMRFAGAVDTMDESVGFIMKALAKKGILQNSIVIFFSDNGAQTFGHLHNAGSNWPFRGLKFTLFQGGVKTPGIIWSSLFKHKSLINRKLFHVTDWMPTLLEAAGGQVNKINFDGKSHWKYLKDGDKHSVKRNKPVLLNIDEAKESAAVISRTGRFKYIEGSFQDGIFDGFYGYDGRSSTFPPYNIEDVLESDTNIAITTANSQDPLNANTIRKLRRELKINQSNNSRDIVTCKPHCLFDLYQDPTETTNVSSKFLKVTSYLKEWVAKYTSELVPQKNQPVDPKSNPDYFGGVWTTWLEYAQ